MSLSDGRARSASISLFENLCVGVGVVVVEGYYRLQMLRDDEGRTGDGGGKRTREGWAGAVSDACLI